MSMNVSSPMVAFKAKEQVNKSTCEHKTCETCGQEINSSSSDTLVKESSKKEKIEKKGFLTGVKNAYVGFKKGLIDVGYITGGIVKGAFNGAATAAVVAGGVALKNVIKKAPTKLGLGGKVAAGVAGLAVMGGTIFKSKLDANEVKAKVDHRWETGHNN